MGYSMALGALGGGVGFIGSCVSRYVGEQSNCCLYSEPAKCILPWVITTATQGIAMTFLDDSPFCVGLKVGAIASSTLFAKWQGELFFKKAYNGLDLGAMKIKDLELIDTNVHDLALARNNSKAKEISSTGNVSLIIGGAVAAVAYSASPVVALILGPVAAATALRISSIEKTKTS